MDQNIKDTIEKALDKVTKVNGGCFEILNRAHIANVAFVAGVCPGMVCDYLKEEIFGGI